MSGGAWIFGYGSLVSPTSLARTIGRAVDARSEIFVAHLAGFGRRWNYGSLNLRGDWHHDGVDVEGGVVISLGLGTSGDERCNGVVVRVSDDELEALDWRERDYERTDITDQVDVEIDERLDAPVVTYVPRPSAIERYVAARDARRGAVRASYWQLVHAAFGDLGGEHPELFEETPAPDVPVVDMRLTSS